MSTVIWRICDHKPGHDNQSHGLIHALAEITDVECVDVPVAPKWQNWLWWLGGMFPLGEYLPRPNLILGAGHATHVAVLAARRACGGKAIVLMKPSLPLRLFDLCVVPEHDALAAMKNLIETRGVLNIVEPCETHEVSRGLILIGGPSSSCGWDTSAMIEQILAVANAQPAVQWRLTTSRRTPAEFVAALEQCRIGNLTVITYEKTRPGWVPRELGRAAQVWVSADSVSMVYEALTSGAAVGLFDVPTKEMGRVARGMQQLCQEGWVTRFADWNVQSPLPSAPAKLHEARRCAELICDRYQLARAA